MKRTISGLLIVLLVALPALGIGMFSWVQARDPQALAPQPTAVLQQPNRIDDDDATEATITATLNPAVTVNAPNWSGTITRVDAGVGTTVNTGTPLLAVDGVTRLAAATDMPFYRILDEGMQGDDVLQLETLLQRLGYFAGHPDNSYDWLTSAAVSKMEAQLGVAQPSGAFDPAWIIWIPSEGLVVGSTALAVNSVAPAQGEPVFATERGIGSVTLETGAGTFAFDGDTRYILSQNGNDIATVGADGDINSELLSHLTASEEDAQGSADMRRYAVTLRREQPVSVLAIPASAVLTEASGEGTCVFGKTGADDADYSVRDIIVAGGSVGVSHVTSTDELAGFYVLTNPLDILGGEAQCPSN